MAKYRVKQTYEVKVENPQTGNIEIEERKYDLEKYHGDKRIKPGDILDLTDDQLKIHGEKYFEPVVEESRSEIPTISEET